MLSAAILIKKVFQYTKTSNQSCESHGYKVSNNRTLKP